MYACSLVLDCMLNLPCLRVSNIKVVPTLTCLPVDSMHLWQKGILYNALVCVYVSVCVSLICAWCVCVCVCVFNQCWWMHQRGGRPGLLCLNCGRFLWPGY